MRLSSETARVQVDRVAGGRIASLVVHGRELLVTGSGADDPMRWGCYPMVPWAGRLRDGVLAFRGERYELPRDLPPHAIHGTGYRSAWAVTGDGRLALDLTDPWPFGGRVVHEIDLSARALTCRLTVRAADVPMPAMAGWHPWFRRSLDDGAPAVVDVGATAMWERGADGIPTGRLVAVPPGPWDDCFTGCTHDPRITWPGAVEVTLRSSCEHWVVYDEPADAVCVEPQSGPPNELNDAPTVVEPGDALVASFELSWREVQ